MKKSILYKFLPIERLSYLEDELLRATQPSELNDPFECLPVPLTVEEAIVLCKKSYKDFNKTVDVDKLSPEKKKNHTEFKKYALKIQIDKIINNHPDNYRDYLIQCQRKRIDDSIGVISFTQRWNSSVMWAHYANSHKGFCIGFDQSDSLFQTKQEDFFTGTKIVCLVSYGTKRMKIPIEKGKMVEAFKSGYLTVFSKSREWSYEKEVRMLLLLHTCEKKITTTPYDINLKKFDHGLIREIIVGAKIDKIHLNKIKKFANSKDIPIFQAMVSEENFDMNRKIIE